MCGIILSENKIKPELLILASKRGTIYDHPIDYNGINLFSTVLNIRSTVPQPILDPKFTLQYNGEIYNNETSDTIYIKETIIELLNKSIPSNIDECLEFTRSVYQEINKNENEAALCITVGDFACFFKDDVGRRSLGYTVDPFILSSVSYTIELDPLKLYVYSFNSKKIHTMLKPATGLVSRYLNNVNLIEKFIISDKFFKECQYLKGYESFYKNSNSDISESLESKDTIYMLDQLIYRSFCKRQYHENPVVFLSGGIDSLIVATYTHRITSKEKTIYLINTAVQGSFDREMGKMAFIDLQKNFPDRNFVFIENDLTLDIIAQHRADIERLIFPKVSKMDFNIGSILYFSAKIASKYSKVVFLGSGADEIFGGYNKYKSDNFREHMFFDLFTISSHNICRDDRVIGNWCVEARFPLLDTEIINFSLDLPRHKFISVEGNKFILREILRYNGFERASYVPKKAMQYGTGMSTFESELYK